MERERHFDNDFWRDKWCRDEEEKRGMLISVKLLSLKRQNQVMEDHTSDQATARDELDGARVLPRRSTRVDVQDPDFKYTA